MGFYPQEIIAMDRCSNKESVADKSVVDKDAAGKSVEERLSELERLVGKLIVTLKEAMGE